MVVVDSKVDLIFQKHVVKFTSNLLYCPFKGQEDGKTWDFAIQKDATSEQETSQYEKNLLEIRGSEVSISKK